MTVEVGQVLDGKYRIVRLIGAGGMGAVYEATHLLIDRRVALKELHADAAMADHAITRFEREARAAGRIGSDHILQIFDVGVLPDGSRYMVSEFLDGETLDARIRRAGRLTAAELLPIIQQLLTGLGAAHQALVLHRDLKPDNIFLVRGKSGVADFVKIIDFGIAKFQLGLNQEDALKMTKTGMVVGTPYYLSPEQARGTGEADARSDLYSVGVILYECITGDVPFRAQNFNDLIFKIVLEDPQPPMDRAPGIERGLSDFILKAMARDPDTRFQSAQEMMGALSAWAVSAEGSRATHFGPRSFTPARGQTGQSYPDAPGGVPFRSRPTPTPASFGATRDPALSTRTAPLGSRSLLLLLLGGLGLVLLGVFVFVLRHGQSKEVASAASAAPPIASSENAARVDAPSGALPPAPSEVVSPAPSEVVPPPDPLLLPPTESEAPAVQLRSKMNVAPQHLQVQKRAAPAAAVHGAPAEHAAPAEPEPNGAAKQRSNWGY